MVEYLLFSLMFTVLSLGELRLADTTTDTDIDTHRHTETQTHIDIQTDTHRHRHRQTDRHRHTDRETCTVELMSLCHTQYSMFTSHSMFTVHLPLQTITTVTDIHSKKLANFIVQNRTRSTLDVKNRRFLDDRRQIFLDRFY